MRGEGHSSDVACRSTEVAEVSERAGGLRKVLSELYCVRAVCSKGLFPTVGYSARSIFASVARATSASSITHGIIAMPAPAASPA